MAAGPQLVRSRAGGQLHEHLFLGRSWVGWFLGIRGALVAVSGLQR